MRLIGLLSLACCSLLPAVIYGSHPNLKEDELMGRECRPGEKPKATPGIKYYLDESRNTAYPFYYKGCGGKVYLYDNIDEVHYLADHQECPGRYHGGRCAVPGGHPDYVNEKCKPGDYCVRELVGGYFGFCCNPEVAERYKKSRSPQCMYGRHPQRYSNGEIVFGKNCSHNFCETGAKCVDGEFDSHCCVSDPDFGRECKQGEKGDPGIKFYLDITRNKAYPYYYKGCGVAHVANTSEQAGYIADWEDCPGFTSFRGSCRPEGYEGQWVSPAPPAKCAQGDFCKLIQQTMKGGCCSNAVKSRYEENRKAAKCGPGREAQRDAKGEIVFGRNCSHNFCQKGATCVDEEFESYCCVQKEVEVMKEDALLGRECRPGEKGTRGEAGIKYFYNMERYKSYPFYYKGCGGFMYFYNTIAEEPRIMDYQHCPGWASFGLCEIKDDYFQDPDTVGKNCSKGQYCQPRYFGGGGFCCSHDIAARFREEESNPKCNFPNQDKPVRDIDGKIIFGERCEHNFCPAGAKCVQGEFQAYCCDEVPNRGRECAAKEKGNSGIKYYYHMTRNRIYPYYYKGCGVPSKELFYRPEDVHRFADHYSCPGFVKFDDCDLRPVFPGQTKQICGEGQYCLNGPHPENGLCCSDAITARYEENQKAAKCKIDERVLKDYKTNQVIFGRSCADDFCPDGARCQDDEFESYCCQSLVDIHED